MAGSTDTSGNLKVVVAAATSDTPGKAGDVINEDEDLAGTTDSKGNLMCKQYA